MLFNGPLFDWLDGAVGWMVYLHLAGSNLGIHRRLFIYMSTVDSAQCQSHFYDLALLIGITRCWYLG